MTILDTFVLLFESDASKLDQGLAETDKKASGLTEKIGGVDLAAGKMGNSLLGALAGFAGAALASFSLAAMTSEIMAAADAADHLDETAERLSVSIEDLSAWGDLVKKQGGSADGFAASIEGLNLQLTQLEVTGKSRAAPFLKELGIDLEDAANKGKTAMDFLPQIADAFSQMGTQQSVALGRRLGFDQATIMTLQAGSREVEALLAKERELGVVTKRQGEIAAEFNDTLDDTRHSFRSVWLGVSEFVLPPLTWMLKKFQEVAKFMREHSDFIVGLMIALGAAIAAYVIPPLISMGAAVVVAFAPFILAGVLVAALATAFALLYEDIVTFMEGGDSMIGQILNRWPVIGDVVRGIVEAFQMLWDIGVGLRDFMILLWDDPAAAFQKFFDFVLNGIKSLVGMVPGLSSVMDALGMGKQQLAAAGGTPLASTTSNSISNGARSSSTSVQIDKVEVQTQATDAAGISKAIGGTMNQQMKQAVNNFDDGVLA